MRLGRGLLIAALCATPMIASATITVHDTIETRTTVVVPVPEPGTFALLLAGISGIAVVGRRRRHKNDR